MRLGTREQGARNPIPFFHISTKLCACRHDVLNPYLATAVFLVTAVFFLPTDYIRCFKAALRRRCPGHGAGYRDMSLPVDHPPLRRRGDSVDMSVKRPSINSRISPTEYWL